jgi:hypothetical protein
VAVKKVAKGDAKKAAVWLSPVCSECATEIEKEGDAMKVKLIFWIPEGRRTGWRWQHRVCPKR